MSELAEIVRHRFTEPKRNPSRAVLPASCSTSSCGNTDDHARNHAAFWDGEALTLTPAYDICPQRRTGGEAYQAMLIHGDDRLSRLATCLDAAADFLLTPDQAKAIVAGQVAVIKEQWTAVCDDASLPETDRALLFGRQFLNPFAFDGAPGDIASLAA